MHLDMLFHIWVRGKLNYFEMVANNRFEGLYALVMRACIKPWSLNDAYYATEVKSKVE